MVYGSSYIFKPFLPCGISLKETMMKIAISGLMTKVVLVLCQILMMKLFLLNLEKSQQMKYYLKNSLKTAEFDIKIH